MARLRWLPEARQDIERLYEFLRETSPEAGRRAVRLIRAGAAQLKAFPEVGKPMGDDTGRRELYLPFGASAYVLRYRCEDGDIVVIRVWHGRERRE